MACQATGASVVEHKAQPPAKTLTPPTKPIAEVRRPRGTPTKFPAHSMALSAQSVGSPENIPPEFPKMLRGERATLTRTDRLHRDAHRRATAMASNPPNTARMCTVWGLIWGQRNHSLR